MNGNYGPGPWGQQPPPYDDGGYDFPQQGYRTGGYHARPTDLSSLISGKMLAVGAAVLTTLATSIGSLVQTGNVADQIVPLTSQVSQVAADSADDDGDIAKAVTVCGRAEKAAKDAADGPARRQVQPVPPLLPKVTPRQ